MSEKLNDKLRAASIEELKQIIASTGMPSDAQALAFKELEKLSHLSPGTASHTNGLNYIGYLISLPWNKKTKYTLDLQRVEEVLNESKQFSQHMRERIWKYLAVRLLHDDKKPEILVVEDEKIALESLSYILKKDGYKVVEANNGAEAIRKLKVFNFDIVLTDLIMGEVDGQAVLEETKRRYPDTPVIIITGYATVDSAIQALRKGAFHYIEKPIKFDEVQTVIHDALRKKIQAQKVPVLCFVCSSEMEITSFGDTIASALGRKFVKISLSGIKDECQIRGQSRTTEDAKAGCVIEGIRSAGVSNPVLMLGEIDMIGEDIKGNVASSLMDLLDPRKNQNFIDHYLEVPFNLSDVMFIVTAHDAGKIKGPVKNLLKIVEL